MIKQEKIFKDIHYKSTTFTGLTDELFSVYIKELISQTEENILIVAPSMYEGQKLYSLLSSLNLNVFPFFMDEFLTSEALATSPELMVERLETINNVLPGKQAIVIADLMGYLRFLPNKQAYEENIITLKSKTTINVENLKKQLFKMGYHRETLVTKTGEVGIRGFVIDIFPISEESPIRIEFFGDEIESIRYFDEKTQKSIKELKEIKIYPFTEYITKDSEEPLKQKQLFFDKEKQGIRQYLNDPLVFFKDYDNMLVKYELISNQAFEHQQDKDQDFKGQYMFELSFKTNDNFYYSLTNYKTNRTKDFVDYSFKKVPNFNENIELINEYLAKNLYSNKTIIISLDTHQRKNVLKALNHPFFETNINQIKKNSINIVDYALKEGFIKDNIVYIGTDNLFKQTLSEKKYHTSYKYASKIKDINKLNFGDYVVHNVHGIGTYAGIKSLKTNNVLKDYVEIAYYGTDKLYIPVEKIDLISKYAGKEGIVPKVHRLGGQEWWKTKTRIREKVQIIAKELLETSAKREMEKGFAFIKNDALEEKFNEDFQYVETDDQLRSYYEIKKDMEKETPMDRLLCGDVGFGKTEIAFRAIFKAVISGKQVLYLCPTTILSNQQYESALERFKNFPINIAILNRFTSQKETKRILADLQEGKIDVVIGTHRLLSDDIKPKDLGLLVVDEEQRFGVTHKEKIKKIRESIDILTLSATPIPRTLQMSLSGLKTMSLIETPPKDRYPVQTYVILDDEQIIKEAIYKELSRQGQVFFLFNKVAKIEEKAAEIKRLVPEAKVNYAHGQMSKNELENRMLSFVNKEYDVLVCTTIIETGIDIPNVNSLIIVDADRFGLSQLYQIRGRVGRSDKIAYAYLFYQKHKVLTEQATKRLETIKEFTELGSGIAVANRDLLIRGAGDILGSEQAGFIDTVGVDLYLKILNDEVARLKGEKVKEEELENPVINVETHISDDYVEEEDLKIEIHRLINTIKKREDIDTITKELEDRFGKVSEEMHVYMYQEWLEVLTEITQVEKVEQTVNHITIIFKEEFSSIVKGNELFEKAYELEKNIKLKYKRNKIYVEFSIKNQNQHFVYLITDFLTIINDLYFQT